MITELIKKLLSGGKITVHETKTTFEDIMDGKISPVLTSAFLTALRFSGETPEEIYAAALVLRERATPVSFHRDIIADIVGTGGDYKGTFNISTASAILSSACGVHIAKHGNRSISSHCGSADILESLGMEIKIPAGKAAQMLENFNFTFLFAPLYHPAMKQIAGVRKELGFKTIFNVLGPMCNPAKANVLLVGVSDSRLFEIIPEILLRFGVKRAWVCFGEDGIDEITLTDKTYIADVTDRIERFEIKPEDFGMKRCLLKDIAGTTASENAEILKRILSSQEKGPKKNIILLNTASLLYISGQVLNVTDGIEVADKSIKSGRAFANLEKIIKFSHDN
ncbi:MAG: anthranilate phosphoribosyltransferase [Candidatus Omnitrophica bacterium]|nr:anthranilate phosphoribosyltransferase [Candidatus Omnitrophota bacterium]